MHDYRVSQFNGGTAPLIGNLTQRSSIQEQEINLFNHHQLAYQKQREVSTTIPMKQRPAKHMNSVTSKQIIHHSKGSQSQYTTTAYTLNPPFSKQPTKSVANSSSKVEYHGVSPPQALAKKQGKIQQRSPLVPKHLLYSVAQSAKKQTPACQRKQMAAAEHSPSPALNYNHHGHQVTKLTVHINGLREGSPMIVARYGENQSASKSSQQKFQRQQPLAASLRQSQNSNKLQTPIKANGAHQQLTTQSVPVAGSHAKKNGKENRQSNQAVTFDVQIKRQNRQANQLVRSPPPKNSKQTPSTLPRSVQKIVSTVPKKPSKSKLTSGTGSALSKKSSQTTAKKNHSQSKTIAGLQYAANQITPSTQATLGLLQLNNSKGSPLTNSQARKVNELYRVSEEKAGSAGSDGSHYFNPQQFMLNPTSQFVKNPQINELPANNVLLPQLNQVAIQPYVMLLSQNGQNVQKKSSPSALTMYDVNAVKGPNLGSFAESTLGKQSQQSGSFINRNHIEGNLQAPQSPTSNSATSSSKKGHQTTGSREVVEVPLSLSLKGKSPVGGHQSPLSVPLQGFSQATLEYLLQTSQKQNKEILTNILKNLALEAQKSSPRHMPSSASRQSQKVSNKNTEEEVKTPVVVDIFNSQARRSSSKSGSASGAQISSSAPPSAQNSASSRKSQVLYQSQVYQEPFKDITSPTLNQQNKVNTSSLVTNNGLLSKPSSILQPFQSSYLIATPNNLQDKSAVLGTLIGGLTPLNNHLKDPYDKENHHRVILLSEDPKQKQMSVPTSQANHQAKVSMRLTKVHGGQENVSIGKSQKTQKKRKSIQDENNAPIIKLQNNPPAATSVSIFHQVLSETPLRRKNQQEPISFSQVPLQELKVLGNVHPQSIKKTNDKKQFDVTVGDFMAVTDKTPQPLDSLPKFQRLDSTLKNQLFDSGQASPKTPNPFLGGQIGTNLQTHSSNQSMGGMMKKYSDKESTGQDPLSSKRRPEMIIQEDFVREEFERMSERSDLISRSSQKSETTVVNQAAPQATHSSKNGNVLSMKSNQRKIASSAAYLQSGSSKKQHHDPLLHIDSDSNSRQSQLMFEKMPTAGIPVSNLVSNREPLDFMETHGRGRINIPNPFIYQAESSNNLASQSSMTTSSLLSSDDERNDKQINNSMVDAEDMKRMVEAKLHHMQFEKVFCHSNYHRDDLMAYFIKRHQIQMGLIPPRDDESCCSSTDEVLSGMSNFSLEIEMLNKLHIEKNNQHKLDQLPVVIDHLLPDPTLTLYQEEATETGIKFSRDIRPRIFFKDPITKTKQAMRDHEDFEGSLTQELKAIQQMKNGIVKVSSAKYGNEGAIGMEGGDHYQEGMGQRYFESSSIDEQERLYFAHHMKSCSCSNNEANSNGHMCLRCQKNQAAIIKRRDYFTSSSAGGHTSSSFSSGRDARCRRRIDKQFTSTEERQENANQQQVIDLQDIKVQPFLAWNEIDQLLTEEQLNHYLQPAILKQSVAPVPPSTLQARLIPQNQENMDAEFEGIPELANLSQNSELLAHLYFRQTQNHSAQRQPNEVFPADNNGPQNQDLDPLYLNRVDLLQNQGIRNQETIPYAQNQNTDMTGTSYDNAVRDFKWLHEVNQDGLDQVLEEEDMKTPAAVMHNQDEVWLNKPFGWTQGSNQIQLQHQRSGLQNGVTSDGSSPTGGLSRAPVKRARNLGPKNTDRQKSSSSQWSCSEQKLQRQVSSAVAMEMFSNSQIKNNLISEGAGPRRLFQDCGSIRQVNSSPSNQSQTSDVSQTPLTFDSKEDAKEFIMVLKSQFNLRPTGDYPMQIQPNIKCFEPSDLRRFTYGLKPAVYNQVPMILNPTEVELEYFDFDEIFLLE